MSAILMQNGKSAFTDANGRPLIAGTVSFYSVGTNTPKDTWRDTGQTILNTNPVILDSRGEAAIYGSGPYRQVLRDSANNLIWDQVIPDLVGSVTDAVNELFLRGQVQVNSVADLRLLDSSSFKSAATKSYYAGVNGGAGEFIVDPLDTTTADNGGSVIVGTNGARWKLVYRDQVTVLQFGAKGDGATDDTSAFQKAIATGLPVFIPKPASFYFIKAGAIVCSAPGQKIFGAGKDVSIIKQTSASVLTAKGLFISTTASGGSGPQFSDFQVTYEQPDVAARESLTSYPVTFYSQQTQRCTFTNLKVQQASYIVDLKNNPGGCNFVGCEFSWYNVAIDIEGSVDSVKIDRCHFWPFGMTDNQKTIFFERNTTGIRSGRMDNLIVDSSLFICGTQINCYMGATGPTFGTITNTDFDTCNGIVMSAGSLDIAGCFFSVGISALNQSIVMTAGSITATACRFVVGLTPSNSQISLQSGGAVLTLVDSVIDSGGANFSAISQASNTTLNISNCYFNRTINFGFTAPTVNILGGNLIFTGNRISLKGSGVGTLLAIASDGQHVISSNSFNGWAVILPTTHSNMLFDGNTAVGASVLQHNFESTTTNSSGKIVVNHNYGTSPKAVFINVANGSTPYHAQADNFTANSFTVTFWTLGGGLLVSTGISFCWEIKF